MTVGSRPAGGRAGDTDTAPDTGFAIGTEGTTIVAVVLPDADTRWRCGRCGNLTRFDVVRTSRVREYWHLDLSGEPAVEQTEVLTATVESVACRWCGADDAVELVARPAAGGPSDDPASV